MERLKKSHEIVRTLYASLAEAQQAAASSRQALLEAVADLEPESKLSALRRKASEAQARVSELEGALPIAVHRQREAALAARRDEAEQRAVEVRRQAAALRQRAADLRMQVEERRAAQAGPTWEVRDPWVEVRNLLARADALERQVFEPVPLPQGVTGTRREIKAALENDPFLAVSPLEVEAVLAALDAECRQRGWSGTTILRCNEGVFLPALGRASLTWDATGGHVEGRIVETWAVPGRLVRDPVTGRETWEPAADQEAAPLPVDLR